MLWEFRRKSRRIICRGSEQGKTVRQNYSNHQMVITSGRHCIREAMPVFSIFKESYRISLCAPALSVQFHKILWNKLLKRMRPLTSLFLAPLLRLCRWVKMETAFRMALSEDRKNEPGAALPHTGGPSTDMYKFLGLILTIGAGILLLL